MVYLLDTQILIWSIVSSGKLSKNVKAILQKNTIWVSQVSLFEIAIKQKIGKLPDFSLTTKDLLRQMSDDGFHLVPIKNAHLSAYEAITLFPEHRDPFDRLILVTAFEEDIPVISADENFKLYTLLIRLIKN